MTPAEVKAERIAQARARKAHLLVKALRRAGATVADLDLPAFPWDDATAAAGVRPPSDATKALVREAMEFLEERDRAEFEKGWDRV